MSDRDIGSTFWCTNNLKLKVVQVDPYKHKHPCIGCYFHSNKNKDCINYSEILGPCCHIDYGEWVIFKQVQ